MAAKITMPKLSDTMTEGVLLRWLKKEGDTVEAGEVMAEAESDKATMELESFDAGILLKINVPEGGKVPVGATLAVIGEKDEDISEFLKEEPKKAAAEQLQPKEEEKTEEPPKPDRAAAVPDETPRDVIITSVSERVKVSPLARKMAAEKSINLRQISGTGTGGRIIKKDIEIYLEKKPVPERITRLEGKEEPLSTMRAVIAERMTQSKTTVPHFYLTMEIDMTKAAEFRKSANEAQSELKISYNDFIVKAAVIALLRHPKVNGSFSGDKLVYHDHVDIGVAVALDEGLITPVVRNCETKSLGQIAREINTLAEKAKKRKLLPNEYTGATFTVSNLGMYGIEEFSAIINPPEAVILAIGGIIDKPVVKSGEIVIGKTMKVTLSCDHRIVDGAIGALYLQELKKLLENPISLLL